MRICLIALLMIATTALAAEQPQSVALKNPGFEDELRGWDNADNPDLAGVFSLDGKVHHGGKFSLHIQAQTAAQCPWVSQKIEKIEPGATYLLRAWDQGGLNREAIVYAALNLAFLDEQGQRLGDRTARQQTLPVQWQALAVSALAPPEARGAVIALRLVGGTEVWFDDVELLRTVPAPALVLRPDRMALPPTEGQAAHLEVIAAEDLPPDAVAQVELLGANDKPVGGVTGQLAASSPRALAGDLKLPKLASGAYRWRVKVGKLEATGKLFVALADRRPKNLNDRGILIVDARPVFPIGIYHVSVADYPSLAQQGFNAAQGLGTHESRLLRTSVDTAHKHSLFLDIPLYVGGLVGGNIVQSQQKLPFFAKSSGVGGWKMADEPDLRPEIADEVPQAYALLKAKDKERPLGLTIERPATYAYWAQFCDSLQVVAFPLPGRELTLVSDRVEAAHKALAPWQHLSALLQAGWIPGGSNQPTLAQARLMVYLAVIHGARGIWWYALRDPDWKLADTKLWADFRRLNDETAALGAVVIEGADTPVQSDNTTLHVAAWKKGDGVRLAIANPDAAGQTALLKLPDAIAKVEIAQGQTQVEVKNGAIQITIPAGEAALLSCAMAPKP